jgi:serine/threonine protein kinase
MDNNWERSIPFMPISRADLAEIFHNYDAHLAILSCAEVRMGCRNSHYKVNTTHGSYFLRIFPPGDNRFWNEQSVFNVLYNKINIPKVHFVSEINGRGCSIYEYINSVSLQSRCSANVRLENGVVCQAAKSAAIMHNFSADDFNGLIEINTPPFCEWFDLFLSDNKTVERIGNETVQRVRRLIADSASKLVEIDRYQSFIHGDFRPANMLLDHQNQVFIVDWEFAGGGHRVADIGQFFRYRNCFDNEHLAVFETEYNALAAVSLPRDWYELSRLRDLVNPLHMLGEKAELQLKFHDLKNLILDTLELLGY